ARAQWVTEVLARPLFAPTRRPAAGAAVSSAEASLPRLAGVIGTPDGTVAIFQPEGDGKPVLVRDGDHLGAWDVTRIEPDAVYLEHGSERMVLNPRFAAGPPPGPNLPAPNPPPPNLSVPAPPVVPPRR
ncbi:MAG TPA: hypothetical protein VE690_09480, partial [Rhodopila sp.]|nr:hypothetical protein [Rhodopila sp.]